MSKLSILQDSFKPSQVFLSFRIKISYSSHDKKDYSDCFTLHFPNLEHQNE